MANEDKLADGFYSKMTDDPLKVLKYKETAYNIEGVIAEIDMEISLRPKDQDHLLDLRLFMMRKLKRLK